MSHAALFAAALALAAPPDPSAELDAALRAAGDEAELWHDAWLATFSLQLAGRGVIAAVVDDRDLRIAQGIAAGPLVAGVVSQLLTAPRALSVETDLAIIDNSGAPPDERARMKRALLVAYAEDEASYRGWMGHLGPLFVNAAAAAAFLFGRDDALGAGLQLGIGMALSELRVWTSPTGATDTLRGVQGRTETWAVTPWFGPRGGGLTLTF